jgi:hypothetical protein
VLIPRADLERRTREIISHASDPSVSPPSP